MQARKHVERNDASASVPLGIRVVDLSAAFPRSGDTSALHEAILNSLRRASAGILSREELLAEAKDHSLAEVVGVLRDLSVRGLVKVLWRSPFSFFAFVTKRGKAERASAMTVLRTHPS